MKAIVIERFGGADALKLAQMPTPLPAANEVQIEVVYAGVNPVDWKIREGFFKERMPHVFPLIPGWEAAGVIKSLGSAVKEWQVGDEVFTYCRKPIVQWGTYAEYVCVDATHLARKPRELSFM